MFRNSSHTELFQSSGAEDIAPRIIILRDAEDDVPRNSIFRATEDNVPCGTSTSAWVFRRSTRRGRCCSAEHLPLYGCSVGVPGTEDVVPRKIFLRMGVPSEYPARMMLFRGKSSSGSVFLWSTQRRCCSAGPQGVPTYSQVGGGKGPPLKIFIKDAPHPGILPAVVNYHPLPQFPLGFGH